MKLGDYIQMDGYNVNGSTCTAGAAVDELTLQTVLDACEDAQRIANHAAVEFNEKFVKPKGFDLEKGHTIIVGRAFDRALIPSKWHKQVIVSGAAEPRAMYLVPAKLWHETFSWQAR